MDKTPGGSPVLGAGTKVALTVPQMAACASVLAAGVLGWARLDGRLSALEGRLDRMDGRATAKPASDSTASRLILIDPGKGNP